MSKKYKTLNSLYVLMKMSSERIINEGSRSSISFENEISSKEIEEIIKNKNLPTEDKTFLFALNDTTKLLKEKGIKAQESMNKVEYLMTVFEKSSFYITEI